MIHVPEIDKKIIFIDLWGQVKGRIEADFYIKLVPVFVIFIVFCLVKWIGSFMAAANLYFFEFIGRP